MQLQEAQEIVRRACQILLITGGGLLVYLGILKWRRPWGRKICMDAEILAFLAEHSGKGALSCPVVNLGREGELRPAAVQSLKNGGSSCRDRQSRSALLREIFLMLHWQSSAAKKALLLCRFFAVW